MLRILTLAAVCCDDEEDVLEKKNDFDDVLIALAPEEGTGVHLHLEDDNYFEKMMIMLTMLLQGVDLDYQVITVLIRNVILQP